MLTADRGFYSWQAWDTASATGAALLWRAPTQLELPVVAVLDDGTYLTALITPAIRGRRRERLLAAARAGSSRASGIALRVCGLLTGGARGTELLEQSVTALEPTPMRLELAHSLTEWGAALRRGGARSTAREPLRRALDLAARCGATPLAERAREEALAAGARPRRPWTS